MPVPSRAKPPIIRPYLGHTEAPLAWFYVTASQCVNNLLRAVNVGIGTIECNGFMPCELLLIRKTDEGHLLFFRKDAVIEILQAADYFGYCFLN